MKKVILLVSIASYAISSYSYQFSVQHFQKTYPDTYSHLEKSVSEHVDQFLNVTPASAEELEMLLNIQHTTYRLSKCELESLNQTLQLLLFATKENLLNPIQLNVLQQQLKIQQNLLNQLGQAQLIWQQCTHYLDENNSVIAEFFSQMAEQRIANIEHHFQTARTRFEDLIKESNISVENNIRRIALAHNAIKKYIQEEFGIEKSNSVFTQQLDIINRLSGSMNIDGQALTKTSYYLQNIIMNTMYEFSTCIDFIYYQQLYPAIEQKIARRPCMIVTINGIVSDEQQLLLPEPEMLTH